MFYRPLTTFTGAALTSVEKRRYVLDSNVATLILDGELWERSSASLIYYRPSYYGDALRKADYRPMEAFHHSLQLRRSVKAYEWAKSRVERHLPPLLIPPRELSLSSQVS